MQTNEKLHQLIIKQLGVKAEKIKAESFFVKDLGADSLDLIEFIMIVEREFKVTIPDEDAEKLKTVQLLENYLNEHAGK